MVELADLEGALGVVFKERRLLEQALVHPSYLNENPGFSLGDNQRLEFLGDAFLGLVVAAELYQRHPGLAEGELTRLRSSIVRGESLARLARRLDLGQYLRMGRGEERTGGRTRPSNLTAALEAVLGALFLDQGYRAGRAAVVRLLKRELRRALATGIPKDVKSQLQERAQARGKPSPRYRVVQAQGPDHARRFTVEVVVAGGEVLGTGRGRSKAEAEQAAALKALKRLKRKP
ncbi:MAG: ribonuclease III [Dehalococcoidia bacterium]